jgi:hypothetical protein
MLENSANLVKIALKNLYNQRLAEKHREISSGVEHCIHTARVASSKLASPTKKRNEIRDLA